MKILLAYDGSASSECLWADVSRAGLPREGEAVVYSVADVWSGAEVDPRVARVFPGLTRMKVLSRKALAEASRIARRGAAQAKAVLPQWRVTGEAAADDPAWAVFKKARDTGADLVIVGSRGLSRWKRITLGSVSQKILSTATVSVRVARQPTRTAGPLRLILAVDGSPHGERAVEEVVGRFWPAGTEARVLAATGRLTPADLSAVARWTRPKDRHPADWLGRMVESAERRLSTVGLTVSGRVEAGDPREVLVRKALEWRADTIFMGARGLSRWERPILGSVSSFVAAHAPCSVEVVRAERT